MTKNVINERVLDKAITRIFKPGRTGRRTEKLPGKNIYFKNSGEFDITKLMTTCFSFSNKCKIDPQI